MESDLDKYGRSNLHYAALDGDVDAVRRLIEDGQDVSLPDESGWTPLHFATQSGRPDVASCLIDAGADVEAPDEHGNTPLHRATFESKGNGEMIAMLRNAGANPLQRNKHGVSPVSLARSIGNYDVAQFFVDVD